MNESAAGFLTCCALIHKKTERYLAGVPFPAFLLTQRVRSHCLFRSKCNSFLSTFNFQNFKILQLIVQTYDSIKKETLYSNISLTFKECRRPESNRYGYHYPRDFKSRASASSATAAYLVRYGAYRARTYDPLLVRQMLSQLS